MTKDEYLREIANTLIEVTREFHDPKRRILNELMSNKLVVDRLIGEEGARIRAKEREVLKRSAKPPDAPPPFI